jgi:hypothetical protein
MANEETRLLFSPATPWAVVVPWGEPGTRQKHVRAVVSRFPFMNENRNETVDTTAIPYEQR